MNAQKQNRTYRTNILLWLGILGPPVAWLVYLESAYLLVHFAQSSGNRLSLHLVSVAFLGVVLGFGAVARSQWHRTNSSDIEFEALDARVQLMSLLGMLAAIEFALLIIVSWIAVFILSPFQA